MDLKIQKLFSWVTAQRIIGEIHLFFPSGTIDEKASRISHKMLVCNNQLMRNKEVLPTNSLKKAAEKFVQFLANVKSKFGSPILVCHGTDYKTLLNNFATVGYDTRLCETITGVFNFWNVIHEDENYPASSSKSLVKLTDGGEESCTNSGWR